MQPEQARLPSGLVPHWQRIAPVWRTAIARLAVVWVALFAVFASDWAAMAGQWWDISTYNHMILIPLIEGWLVWQRRDQLAKLEPCGWWPGLLLFAGAGFLWVLGAFSGLDLARQAGVVAMLGASVPLLLGVRVTAALLFPLCYLAFLVPFGEELVKPLQMITAHITIGLTHFSGIPAVIDGVFIDTPAGLFEVAEACSGVKFLIAMIAFGVLAANVCFIDWRRRIALIAACLVVPVLANGVRAWATIYAAQIVGVEKAAGFDHIVYGWIFFALVLTLVIAGAWRFFDRPVHEPMVDAESIGRSRPLARLEQAGRAKARTVLAAIGIVVLGFNVWAFAADRLEAPMPRQIDLPRVPGWTRVNYAPQLHWEPRAEGAEHKLLGSYRDGLGRKVDVFVALYAAQGEGREAGGFGQGALMPDSPWSWQAPVAAFDEGKGERLLGLGHIERVAMTWYRTGELLSGSNARLKLAVIADRLMFRARPTAMLVLSAEDGDTIGAEDAIAAFRRSTGPLDAWMDHMAQLR